VTARSLFVLGGARSGKSRYAQTRAEAIEGRHIFIATAEAFDDEMRGRIARHQADRDQRWETVEAPRDLPGTIDALNQPDAVVLVDCLTLWMSNLLLAGANIGEETQKLCRAAKAFQGHMILVANEVGFGIVPDNALAREFRDEAGRTNQIVAAQVDEVQLVIAGLSLRLK
jgi:adenosylcobinamide kinase/adenosylcobinamide-phosphate guanylyltransferase